MSNHILHGKTDKLLARRLELFAIRENLGVVDGIAHQDETDEVHWSLKCTSHAHASTAQIAHVISLLGDVGDLTFHLAASKVRDASPLNIGDLVKIAPAWRMGPTTGHKGFEVQDEITGIVGEIVSFSSNGDDIMVRNDHIGFEDWAPTPRVELYKK